MIAAEGEGIGIGTVLVGVAGLMFVSYVYYKVSERRHELRETVQLLTDEGAACVADLEGLVASGAIKPVS